VSWFQIGAAKTACATTTWAKSSGSALRICRLSVMPVAVALRSLGLRGFQPSVPPPCSLLEVLGAKARG
jgi:hypothetical protein